MAPYLPNNLTQKARVSHLRPNLAFPQRAHSLSLARFAASLGADHQMNPSPFHLLWSVCEASWLSHVSREE